MLKRFSSKEIKSNSSNSFQIVVLEECLRQSKLTFNLAFFATALSLGIGITGAILLFSGRISAGTATTATGILSTSFCTQLAKSTSERLKELSEHLKVIK